MAKPSIPPEKKMAHPAKDEPKMKKAPHTTSNNLGKWLHPAKKKK